MVGRSEAGWTLNCARFFLSNGDELLLASFSPHSIEGIRTECIGGRNYDADRHKHLYFTRVPRLRRILRQFKLDLLDDALQTAIDNVELRKQAFKDNISRVAGIVTRSAICYDWPVCSSN
jgi:hypothetical protein